jgi:MFS transporter, YNFM family, putative membrane transport protein
VKRLPLPVVVSALYLTTMTVFADMYITQPLLPQLAGDFGVSAAIAGLTISAVVLTTALASGAYGPLSDVLGRRPIMVWGTVLLALSTLACAFAPSFELLVVLRAVQGILVPCVSALAVAYIHEDLGPCDTGAIVGGYVAASVAGGLLGRILSGVIADTWSWRANFELYAAITLVGAVALALTLRSGVVRKRVALGPDLAASYRSMFSHVRDVRLIGAFLIGFALFFGFIGIFTYLPFYVTAPPFGLSMTAVSWLYAPYLAGVVVSPIAGRLSRHVSRRMLMAIGIVIAIAGIAASLEHNLVAVVVSMVVLCAGMFIAQPVAPTFVTASATKAKGSATALYQSFYYLGAVFGSFVPGLAWERWAWPGVVVSCIGSLVIALLANWLLCGTPRAGAKSELAAA